MIPFRAAYLEKEHPDWLRALMPRHIQRACGLLAAAKSAGSLIGERRDAELRQHPRTQDQAHVPTYYVSRELLAAAARTELPDHMVG